VFSISIDSNFSHKIWNEIELSKMVDGGIPFPMLSDPGGRIGRLYNVYAENAGVDIRWRFMEVLTPEVGRNVSELIRQLRALKHVTETGEVTPSGWQPGGKTLKPGAKLIGNVWKEWKPADAYE
jgi:alkyl hydroperoxide reductase subunit AhpC